MEKASVSKTEEIQIRPRRLVMLRIYSYILNKVQGYSLRKLKTPYGIINYTGRGFKAFPRNKKAFLKW